MIDEVVTDPRVLAEMEMIFATVDRKRARRLAGLGPAPIRRPSNRLADFPIGTSCVYVIGEDDQRMVKIGWSTNLATRLSALRCGSAHALMLLWVTDGGRKLERALHDHFSSQWIKGEWFGFPDGDAVERVQEAISALDAAHER